MPVNRNALIRYRTIDTCLRNRHRRWTLEDLIEACSEALYEYEGIDKGVSRRSIQMDIQLMRSDKLGYNAPITVLEKKYYTYDDPEYSITNIPLTDQDLGKLTEVVEILRQFKGFSHFQELSGMVQRLENKIHAAKTNQEPIIDFEKNENLKGLEHIETLYQAIMKKCTVQLCYQSFKARSANEFPFHPYYLKEYRNRWFVIGVRKRGAPVTTLALDRIISISDCEVKYAPRQNFNLNEYFHNVLGVTVNPTELPEKILIFADRDSSPYIITKPIHHSQQIVEESAGGVVFSLHMQLNFELERELLGFGDRIRVLAPEKLRRRIKEIVSRAFDHYQFDFSASTLHGGMQKLLHRGSCMFNSVYGKKEITLMKMLVAGHFREAAQSDETHALRKLLHEIPALKAVIFNANLTRLLKALKPGLFLTKAIYFDKTPESNWFVSWHQDIVINVKDMIETPGFTNWTKKHGVYGVCPPDEYLKSTVTIRIHLDDADEFNGALKVVQGSHNKKLSDEEIALISQNSTPLTCDVGAGGVHIMRPLLLHSSAKATSQKRRRVLHLEFNTMELPNGLAWAERDDTLS